MSLSVRLLEIVSVVKVVIQLNALNPTPSPLGQFNFGAKTGFSYHRGVWGAGGVIGLCGVPIRILYQKVFFDSNLDKNPNKFFPLLPLPLFLSVPQNGIGIVISISISISNRISSSALHTILVLILILLLILITIPSLILIV